MLEIHLLPGRTPARVVNPHVRHGPPAGSERDNRRHASDAFGRSFVTGILQVSFLERNGCRAGAVGELTLAGRRPGEFSKRFLRRRLPPADEYRPARPSTSAMG